VQLRGSLNRGRTIIESFADQTYATIAATERGDDETSSGRLILEHSLGARGDVGLGLSMVQVDYREGINADPAAFYRQRLWSAGLETDYEFDGGLQLAGSAALDGFSTPLSGGRPALGERQTWAVRAGLTQTLASSGVQLTAAAISRSRFPSLRELYSGALGRFLPNPTLRPERLLGTEAGATLYRGAWKWQALVFHQQLDDVILRVNVPGPGRLQQRVNRDAQRSTGLELAGTLTGDRHTLLADLTVQDVRVLDPTQANGRRQVEYQPKVRGSLTGVAPVGLGWRGTAAVQLVGAQYCLNPGSGNYDRLATTGRGDVMVDRSFAVRAGRGVLRSLRLLFAVDNVFDTLTWDQCGLPQPGRLVRLGFELR
jgi:iron complex outermembrane receptor protein